jgi:hypothetical protein
MLEQLEPHRGTQPACGRSTLARNGHDRTTNGNDTSARRCSACGSGCRAALCHGQHARHPTAAHGKGFCYRVPDGRPLTDRVELARIKWLAIPPAWTDVWICPYRNGHLQATGFDARGRKQYRYHPDWRKTPRRGQVRPHACVRPGAAPNPRPRRTGPRAPRPAAGKGTGSDRLPCSSSP